MYQALWLHVVLKMKRTVDNNFNSSFMSCSARLPIYALFVGVFFKTYQSLIVLSLYLLGILVALIVSTIMNRFILKTIVQYLLLSYQLIVYLLLELYGVALGKRQKAL